MGGLGAPALRPCGDRPFLAWLLREFVRFGVEEFLLPTGHLSAEVAARVRALSALLPRKVRIVIVEAPPHAGTGGAVFHAREQLDRRFLLCRGDSLFDFNLATLLAAAAEDGPDVTGRIVLRRRDDSNGLIKAGVYLFGRRLVDDLAASCSLEGDITPRLAARGVLRETICDGPFRDIGTPDGLARAQQEMPRVLRRRALFLDRDGVINVDHGWVGTRDRFEWTPGSRETIRAATEAGWHVFVATNQSGVARGHFDEAAVAALHAWMVNEVRRAGGTIDDIRYCPFHAEADVPAYRRASDWRKPAPGMLLDLMRAWELDPTRCLLVGDQESDMAAAEAAGISARRFEGGDLAAFVRPFLPASSATPGPVAVAHDPHEDRAHLPVRLGVSDADSRRHRRRRMV
jgi:D-glycero-D-manno-heptose 1,7-bisphosphate phosphatase